MLTTEGRVKTVKGINEGAFLFNLLSGLTGYETSSLEHIMKNNIQLKVFNCLFTTVFILYNIGIT